MFRLVLFDIDGTLIQTDGAGQTAFARVCREVFGVAEGAAGLNFAGRTDTSIIREFFERHGIEACPANQVRFVESYLAFLRATLQPGMGRVLPGIVRWLEVLGARSGEVTIGLLTGNVREGARIKLGHYGLWNQFLTGAYGDDHEDRNEVAGMALRRGRALFGASLRGDQLLVIGDTPRDVACARAIGAKALAVATGPYTREDLQIHQPDWLAEDLEQLSAEAVLDG